MGIEGPIEKVIELMAKIYLNVTKNSAGKLQRKSSEMFHDNFIPAPSLWFYSHADPVAKFEDCETVITKWKAKGASVESCIWKDTPHIQHGRLDPERYFGTLKHFLEKNNVIS